VAALWQVSTVDKSQNATGYFRATLATVSLRPDIKVWLRSVLASQMNAKVVQPQLPQIGSYISAEFWQWQSFL